MGFERWGRRKPNLVSILPKTGNIFVSTFTMRQCHFEGCQAALLFYDKETTRVGMRLPVDGTEEGALRCYHCRTTSSMTIAASPFFREYGLIPRRTTRYAWTYDAEEGLYVIDLRQPLPSATEGRTPSGS